MIGVYKITNLDTGDFYIGQSKNINRRWKEHFSRWIASAHSQKFQDDINQYGEAGFSFQVIEECEPEILLERERYWINTLHPSYNTITDGHVVSEETRSKISASLAGKKQSPELVEKRRQAIIERHKTFPQTNSGHYKKVAVEDTNVIVFESVKACAEYLGVDASTMTHALKRGGNVKGKKVWYVV